MLIEIEREAGTISGQLAVEGAPARDFFGWLELIDRLERATDHRGAKSTGRDRAVTCARPDLSGRKSTDSASATRRRGTAKGWSYR